MNDKSMLEVAVDVMKASSEPKNIYKLIDEVMETLGLGDDANLKAQLYIDITTCADFVFLGGEDDLWDLKTRQPLEAWDKSFYENESSEDDIEDDEDNISIEDYNYVEDESDEDMDEDSYDEDEEEETSYEIDEDSDEDEEDEENSWDEEEENSWDEDEEEKYNDMMDDYEDLYEDK